MRVAVTIPIVLSLLAILSRDSDGAVHEPDRAITVAAQKARGRFPTGLQDAILPHIP